MSTEVRSLPAEESRIGRDPKGPDSRTGLLPAREERHVHVHGLGYYRSRSEHIVASLAFAPTILGDIYAVLGASRPGTGGRFTKRVHRVSVMQYSGPSRL